MGLVYKSTETYEPTAEHLTQPLSHLASTQAPGFFTHTTRNQTLGARALFGGQTLNTKQQA